MTGRRDSSAQPERAREIELPDYPDPKAARRAHRWLAQRPEVLPYIVAASGGARGTTVFLRGSAADLIAAGLAQAEWFEYAAASGHRTLYDEFGSKVQIQRRARGVYEIRLHTEIEGWDFEPKRWRERLDATLPLVATALTRARPA